MADTKLSQLTLKTGDMVASDLVEITEGGNTTKSVTGTKILGFVSANITGITTSQADAIVANTAKTGITSEQASAIVANTAKTGITSGQASEITANTAKTGITSGQANAITANTAKVTNATHTGEVTGATALTIADNVVDEANLKVSNAPTNGYALTAQSGNTGGLTWAEMSGGGASTLTEVLSAGNRTTTDEKIEFRDAAIYINSSADGQLDIVADTEIQIAATTIDINGAVALNGALTGITNITLSGELDAATGDFSGDVDVDGTLEADAITLGGTALGSLYSPIAGSSSIVTTGALNSGSITSGFGTINNGASAITTTGALGAGTITGATNITTPLLTNTATPTRDKIRVWSDATYTIGMDNGITFGAINNDYAMTFQMNSTNGRGFWWGDSVHTDAQGAMSLSTDGKLTVATGARIGFGESDTTIPSAGLQVSGAVTATGGFTGNVTGSSGSCTGNAATATAATRSDLIDVNNYSSTTNMRILGSHQTGVSSNVYSNANMYLNCETGIINAAGFYASGNITAYSDKRVKTNFEVIPNALEKVSKLSGYTFDRTDLEDEDGNAKPVARQTGVIAQEVLEVLPEVVSQNPKDGMYGVAYGNMVGLLIEAIKELKAEVEELKGNK